MSSDEIYNKKLKSVQRFIPFLENMIEQLKDPKMRNREQQLNKMESLYGMITDKKKKLKVETLTKCEDVIVKLYQKVKGTAALPPIPSDNETTKRKIDLYSLAGESLQKRKQYDEFDILPSTSQKPQSFFLRKPPISYADLEILEKDVASELESKMSLQELNSLRKKLFQQLEEADVDSEPKCVPPPPRISGFSPEKSKKIQEKSNHDRKNKSPSSRVTSVPSKLLKDSADIFACAFTELDKTYEAGTKKRDEWKNSKEKKSSRRNSDSRREKEKPETDISPKDKSSSRNSDGKREKEKEKEITKVEKSETDVLLTDKIAQIKQLAEKAAELKKKILPKEILPPKQLEVENGGPKGLMDVHSNFPSSDVDFSLERTKVDRNGVEISMTNKTHQVHLEKQEVRETNSEDRCKSQSQDIVRESRDSIKENKDEKEKEHAKKIDGKPNKKMVISSNIETKKAKSIVEDVNDIKKPEDNNDVIIVEDDQDIVRKKNPKDFYKIGFGCEKKSNETTQRKVGGAIDSLEKRKDKDDDKVKSKLDKVDNTIKSNQSNKTKEVSSKAPINRDPRLKSVTSSTKPKEENRLAFKYNPKPKNRNPDEDLERNVAASIEKSMMSSHVPLPPKAHLKAPPVPPEDLFSPASPDEIDKKPVPAILNDILLNPNTTGVINEVVTALKRSNELNTNVYPTNQNLSRLDNSEFNNIINQSEFHFSPPPQQFMAETVFVPPKPVPPPCTNNSAQNRAFNHFAVHDKNANDEAMPVLDFQPPRNNIQSFDNIPLNPPHLTPYEDRMAQGYNLDNRALNFVPPTPAYVPPSPMYEVPPSPMYEVPPSPMYEGGGNDKFYNNYQNDRNPNLIRIGLLGDYPNQCNAMQPTNQFGFSNYDSFYNNQQQQQQQTNFHDPRKQFGATRDPRMNANRMGPSRVMGRDTTTKMTYKEYKEQKERENKEKEIREKEMRDREIRERENREREIREREMKEKELVERQKREKEESERIAKEKEAIKRSEIDKIDESKSRSRDRGRESEKSRDRYNTNRSTSRYRRERSVERPKFSESKFDKVYSSREKDKEDFTSPLESLYTPSASKTGRGYGIQFKIPKKVCKEDDKMRKDEVKVEKKKDKETERRDVEDHVATTDDKNTELDKKDQEKRKSNKRDNDKHESDKTNSENRKSNRRDERKKSERAEEKSDEEVSQKQQKPKEKKGVIKDDDEDEEEVTTPIVDKSETTDVVEQVKVEDSQKTSPEKEKTAATSKEINESLQSPAKEEIVLPPPKDSNEEKPTVAPSTSSKKEEEESILSRFFTNLMKSTNKDEKKGALLSLISTFSDSFSDHQMQRITKIIKSEEDNEETEKVNTELITPEPITKTQDEKEEKKEKEEEEDVPLIEEPKVPENVEQEEVETPAITEDETDKEERVDEQNETEKKIEPQLNLKKGKTKTELDRLHEDIREMFIRDGVVTASGKRMCRLLKDTNTPAELAIENERPDGETKVETDTKKKVLTGKKRGRKPGWNKKKELEEVEMRELSVILPKMSLDKIKEVEEISEQRYSLRHSLKVTNYNENNDKINRNERDSSVSEKLNESISDQEIEQEQDTETNEKELDNESNVEETKKTKTKKKTKSSWATGIIKRKIRRKIQSDNNDAEKPEETPKKSSPKKIQPSNLHDKDYYLKADKTSLPCKLCSVSKKWIGAHYRTEHPDEEVFSSRPSPECSKLAIEDAIANEDAYRNDNEVSNAKHDFACVFCDFKMNTFPRVYRDHVSIHTGEFRHKCPDCNFSRSQLKSVKKHITEFHADDKNAKKNVVSLKGSNNRNVYAYLCEFCHYTQMMLENVENHVKIYHSGSKKCKIYRIKVNMESSKTKTEVEKSSPKTKERSTRSSAKLVQSYKELPSREEEAPEMDKEDIKVPIREPDSDDEPPELTREVDEDPNDDKTEEESTTSEIRTPSLNEHAVFPKKTRKRRKSCGAARFSTRKRKNTKVCSTPFLSSTENETDSEAVTPKANKKQKNNYSSPSSSKKIDEAVFTCNTDIMEDNRKIEEERMKMMQDINSSIKLRTSLDFVEKLSNRLKQEEVIVKQEPCDQDQDNNSENKPSNNELPVFEKSVLHKKDVRQDASPKVSKDCGKANPIISNVIEKLQGILNNDNSAINQEDLPPLKHINEFERPGIIASNSKLLNVGPIKVIRSGEFTIFACCSPPCIFSTKEENVFSAHCQFDHNWDDNMEKFAKCLECEYSFDCNEDYSLLSCAYDHAKKTHADFFGVKVGSIRVSTNLFPEVKPEDEIVDSLKSENDLTDPPTISIPSPLGGERTDDDVNCLLSNELMTDDAEDENPFSFKIVDVVSLADSNEVPPLKMIEAKDTTADSQQPETSTGVPEKSWLPKKSPVAIKKFLVNQNVLFKCPEYGCLFMTNRRKMFDIHIKMHSHHQRPMSCLYCDKAVTWDDISDHYEHTHGMCRFACSYCFYRCIAKDYMDVHLILSHPDQTAKMQLLPKRDLETDKKLISIMSEATKPGQLTPYRCCNEEFVLLMKFKAHVDRCALNTLNMCFHKNSATEICKKPHRTFQALVKHWAEAHGVHIYSCSYCAYARSDVLEIMIHLVLEHPTLPPDVLDRSATAHKNTLQPKRAYCNFKNLIQKLRTNYRTTPPVPKTEPGTAHHLPLTKLTPVTFVPSTTTGSISVLKPVSRTNVLASGGVVYCLAPTGPAGSSQAPKQLVQAIVVNGKDGSPTGTPQKVRLLSGLPTTLKNSVHTMIPLAPAVPKLAPISPGSRLIAVKPLVVAGSSAEAQQASEGGGGGVAAAAAPKLNCEEDRGAQMAGDVADEEAELPNLEEAMMVINEVFDDKGPDDDVDPLSLDNAEVAATVSDPSTKSNESPRSSSCSGAATPLHEYDSDSKEVDVAIQKTGLIGYQLYRCAKCDLSFSDGNKFKDHVIRSTDCRYVNVSNKPFRCVHCGKYVKQYTQLLDHMAHHGISRFLCSLCNQKFAHVNQVKHHMKSKHNVSSIVVQPLIQNKTNLNYDEFVIKPQTVNMKTPIKEPTNDLGDTQKPEEIKTVYFSHESESIPQKSILSYDITCGHCKKFKNKVRSNIVRHLLLHKNDQEFTVPDTAPVNPVPCLEKNEKMFDKMYNLASSSHTGGRMGGQQKGDTKKVDKVTEENYPAFVPANKRFQCCAVGCNYLCLEEGNLRHHISALHMEDLNFVCVHCKRDLSDAEDVDTILKHLKLHELHLYKCSCCDFMHNLRHKVERHCNEKHKNKESNVVVIRSMDSEPYDENQVAHAPFPVAMNQQQHQQRSAKPWRCCMCKYKCHTQEEAETHAKNKHDVDCRYKCALCAFKSNELSVFKDHFKETHVDNDINVILAYHKEEEPTDTNVENDQFDTTPLWLRDKPRVRHIRGILFDDANSPTKRKTFSAKGVADTAVNNVPSSSSTTDVGPGAAPTPKRRKRSVSNAIAEKQHTASATEEEGEDRAPCSAPETKPEIITGETLSSGGANVGITSSDVIVIEDEEAEDENNPEEQEFDDIDLLCTFGDIGMPQNRQFRCPKCDKYRTTKMKEFVQHVAREINYYRFICTICEERYITLESIKMHCIDYHDCSIKSVQPLPVDKPVNRWLTILLERQWTIIKNLGFYPEELPNDIEKFLGSHDSSAPAKPKEKPIKCAECFFTVSGAQAMQRHLRFNHPHLAYDRAAAATLPTPATAPTVTTPDVVLLPVVETTTTTMTSSKKRPLAAETTTTIGEAPKRPRMSGGQGACANLFAKDRYYCSLCSSCYDSVPEMEFHGKEAHDGEVMYVVQTTEMPMNYSYGNKNIYRCRYCATTGSKASLTIHNEQDHPGQKMSLYRFMCGVCPAKFELLKSFKQHFKTHDLSTIFYYDVHDKKTALRTRSSTSSAKNKKYRCPLCTYVSHSNNSTNMRTHLKTHARPIQCDLCLSQFKTRPDAKHHHLKEHPHNVETISEREDMIQKINSMMEEVLRNVVVVVEDVEEVPEGETMEIEPDLPEIDAENELVDVVGNEPSLYTPLTTTIPTTPTSPSKPDAVPSVTISPVSNVVATPSRPAAGVAKKSTSPLSKHAAGMEYSFYGEKPKEVDMRKITTVLEIGDATMPMTCDQLGRIYNIRPTLKLKDCMTLIIDEGDEEEEEEDDDDDDFGSSS